jgi:hypothetical protein
MTHAHRGLVVLLLALPLAVSAEPKDAPVPRTSGSLGSVPDRKMVEVLPPHIDRVAAFSQCNPGAGILVKGTNFGPSPGRLFLAGYFPKTSSRIELEQLVWGSGAIGGQVPMVEGVLNQTVTLGIVTRDGRHSNGIPCELKATRVEVLLPKNNQTYSQGYCDLGDNYFAGNVAYDADEHGDIGTSSGTVICYHKSHKPMTHGDNNGTDLWRIRKLENGWTLSRMSVGDSNGGSGEILSRKGFKAGATTADIEVRWRMGHTAVVHHSFDLYVEGPAGVPMHERVALPDPPVLDLDDWNPVASKGDVLLTIVSPSASIVMGSPSFELAITAASPQPDWMIQVEWALLTSPKDSSLGEESWNVGQPSTAPTLVAWNQFPVRLSTLGAFDGKNYAVRAKVKSQAGNTWTEWKRFQMVSPATLQAMPSPDGPKPKLQRVLGGNLGAKPVAGAKLGKVPQGLGALDKGLSPEGVQKSPATLSKPRIPHAAPIQKTVKQKPGMGGQTPQVDPVAVKKLPGAVPPPPSDSGEEEEQELRVDPSIRFPR